MWKSVSTCSKEIIQRSLENEDWHIYTRNLQVLPWIPGERVPEKSVVCENVDAYSEEEEKLRGKLEKYVSL